MSNVGFSRDALISDFIRDIETMKENACALTGSRKIIRGINRSLTRMESKGDYRYVQMAKNLLKKQEKQAGFNALEELGEPGKMATVESVVVMPKYRILFTEKEINTAKARLGME